MYWLQHQYSKLKSNEQNKSQNGIRFAKNLKENGYAILDPQNVDKISTTVTNYFNSHKCEKGLGYVDKQTAQNFSNELFDILQKQAFDVLYSYYKSSFQNYWVTVMRYEEAPEWEASSAFGYHIDDNPRELLKIFIYLNDTFESNGAFRAFDYSDTKDMIRKGFISCSPELRIKSQNIVDENTIKKGLKVLAGKKGTILIFDNNLIHKGTLPKEGIRDIICVEVYPSPTQMTPETLRKGLAANFVVDFPSNPFFNDILEAAPQTN